MKSRKQNKTKKNEDTYDPWFECTIELHNGHKFTVVHNLPDVPGLRIQDAIANWEVRTSKYTAESLINYINSKNTGFIIMTKKRFNELSAEVEAKEKQKEDENSGGDKTDNQSDTG